MLERAKAKANSNMSVSIEEVKKLRDLTGISIMQCKKVLEEADGDMDKAVIMLQKLSSKAAEKKSDRSLGAGVVAAYIHAGGKVGAMVELACETDFVAKNEEFQKIAYDIAMHVAASNPEYLREEDIDDDARAKATEVFEEEVDKSKPEDIQKQILQGKLDAHFKEKVLLNQSFVKDPEKKISQLLEEGTQKFGERMEVTRFERFAI